MVTDPVDKIILREAATQATPGQVVVLDDVTGGLVLGLSTTTEETPMRVHCDLLTDEHRTRATTAAAGLPLAWHPELSEALLKDATLVVLRLPKSLAALDELAEAVAMFAHPDVRLVAGGRVKHMGPGMNRVLRQHFGCVSASLGQQKSRVLLASKPKPHGQLSYPRCQRHDTLQLTVCAHGAAFAGSAVDAGTRLLASVIPQLPDSARRIVDLGCGTGVLATLIAHQRPAISVDAVDESAAACRSAAATATGNGVGNRVRVQRGDLLSGVAEASVDLIVCNPPFHRGTARNSDAAFAMFAEARRTLRPSGELWTVHNSHLPYLAALRREVGQTSVVVQNPHFTVTRSLAPKTRE